MNIPKLIVTLLLFHTIATITVSADIYKCVDTEDKVAYLDKPCPVDDDEESLRHVKDPEGVSNLPPTQTSAEKKVFKPSNSSHPLKAQGSTKNHQPSESVSLISEKTEESTSSKQSNAEAMTSDSQKNSATSMSSDRVLEILSTGSSETITAELGFPPPH